MAPCQRTVSHYCTIEPVEAAELASPRAPIVLLRANGTRRLPEAIAPGLDLLGFMLPTTPLHLLLLEGWRRPLVMTSGNVSGEPQIIADAEASQRLGGMASHALVHDRPIANRIDDSVVRMMAGRTRVLRRARGVAPAPIRLPEGFQSAPEILAMGGELKATFCLSRDGEAILSQHIGDLEQLAAWEDYLRNLALYRNLFDHRPTELAADMHPEYLSSKEARAGATRRGLRLIEVQHHHAHVAACLAENGWPLDGPPVLRIALDGLGWGEDGTIRSGEFLLADYRACQRLAAFRPVPMPGGAAAASEPWRSLHAHLAMVPGRDAMDARFAGKPLDMLDAMLARGLNAPPASSCGRLFDAVAAALGLCFDSQGYEGEAAARLEAIADWNETGSYPFALVGSGGLSTLDARPMWRALLDDLAAGVPAAIVSARFHRGVANACVATARTLAGRARFDTVALSGGCFQNRLLFEGVAEGLEAAGFVVLSHADVPANDGGLALGQVAVAAARLLSERTASPCA